MNNNNSGSFFDQMDSKTTFIVGMVTAVLALGTLGFVLLGSCMLTGGCSGLSGGDGEAVAANNNADTGNTGNQPSPNQPTPPTAGDQPTGDIPEVTEDDHIRGDADAEITLVEYSDFECPFCQRFTSTVDQVLSEYDGDVRFVYRHFPLNSIHPQAEPAAEAAECAGEQGAFWEFHDALFENQSQLGSSYYTQLAEDLGLNTTEFQDCIDSDRMMGKVRQQLQDGQSAGVTGTPGSFLIGPDGETQMIKGAQPFGQVQGMIESML